MLRWGRRCYVFDSSAYSVQVWVGLLSRIKVGLVCKQTGSTYTFTVQNNEVNFGEAGVLLPDYLVEFIKDLKEAM